MVKTILVLLVLVYSSCVSSSVLDQNYLQINNQIIEKNIEILNGTDQIEQEAVGQTLRYAIGHRTALDKIIAQGTNSYRYPFLQNIKLKLNYPSYGVGKIVTYCEIIVDQSSNQGRGYVVSGGIRQRKISIVIEANSTMFFAYKAYLYGY